MRGERCVRVGIVRKNVLGLGRCWAPDLSFILLYNLNLFVEFVLMKHVKYIFK